MIKQGWQTVWIVIRIFINNPNRQNRVKLNGSKVQEIDKSSTMSQIIIVNSFNIVAIFSFTGKPLHHMDQISLLT